MKFQQKTASIACFCLAVGFWASAASAETEGAYGGLVNNLRKNPVPADVQAILAKPDTAPLPASAAPASPVKTAPVRQAAGKILIRSPHHSVAAAARAPSPATKTEAPDAADAVAPYTDSFFNSKVSPY